jgi:hypothetical protein
VRAGPRRILLRAEVVFLVSDHVAFYVSSISQVNADDNMQYLVRGENRTQINDCRTAVVKDLRNDLVEERVIDCRKGRWRSICRKHIELVKRDHS